MIKFNTKLAGTPYKGSLSINYIVFMRNFKEIWVAVFPPVCIVDNGVAVDSVVVKEAKIYNIHKKLEDLSNKDSIDEIVLSDLSSCPSRTLTQDYEYNLQVKGKKGALTYKQIEHDKSYRYQSGYFGLTRS